MSRQMLQTTGDTHVTLSTENMRVPTTFAMIPQWIKTSGIFAEWAPTTCKIYLALLFHVNARTRLAYPSLRTLCAATVLNRKTVSKGVNALWKSGAISIRRTGYKQVNCYFVPIDPAKCPKNWDAYCAMRKRRMGRAKCPKKWDGGRPTKRDALTRCIEQEKSQRSSHPLQPIINHVIQNIIQVKSPSDHDVLVDTPPPGLR